MRQMRSSVIFLGALLSRCGEASLSLPGGCELGPRPVDRPGVLGMIATAFGDSGVSLNSTIALSTLRTNVDFAHAEAVTAYGRLGVKVWISRPEPKKSAEETVKEGR